METKLIVFAHVNPSPYSQVLRSGHDLSVQEYYSMLMDSGIKGAAHVFVKYHGRLVSDGSGRQEVAPIYLTPTPGVEPLQALNLSKDTSDDLQAHCARIALDSDGQSPEVGLIVHLEYELLRDGKVDMKMLGGLNQRFATELETLSKIKTFSCFISSSEPRRNLVGLLKRDVLGNMTDLPGKIVLSAFPGFVKMKKGDTPGKTLFVYGHDEKDLFTNTHEGQWIAVDETNYSDNRKKRAPTDLSSLVATDLKRVFQRKELVKQKTPEETVPGLKVMLKTHEKIYLDGTENGTKPGVAFVIKADQITGKAFDDINEGDRLDVWVIEKNTSVKASPIGDFTATDIEKIITAELDKARSFETLDSRINSLIQRSERLYVKPLPEDPDWAPMDKRHAEDVKKLQIELAGLKKIITDSQKSQQPKELQRNLDSSEAKLKSAEQQSHGQLNQRFLAIRKPQDQTLLELSDLIQLLNYHELASTSAEDKSEFNAIQRKVLELYSEYSQGRDDVNWLAMKLTFTNEDQRTIEELKGKLKIGVTHPTVAAMEQKVHAMIFAKQSEKFPEISEKIAELKKRLAEVGKTIETMPDDWKNIITGWMEAPNNNCQKIQDSIEGQQSIASSNDLKPWVSRQTVVDPTFITSVNQRIDALNRRVLVQQQAQNALEKRTTEQMKAIAQYDFGAKFVIWANRIQNSSTPKTQLAIKSRLIQIMDGMLEDETLRKRVEPLFSQPIDELKLETVEGEILLHRIANDKLNAEDFFKKYYEPQFMLLALTKWVEKENQFLPNSNRTDIRNRTEELRAILSAKHPEFKLPKYDTDFGIEIMGFLGIENGLEKHIADLRKCLESNAHFTDSSEALENNYAGVDKALRQQFQQIVRQVGLTETYLQDHYPAEVAKIVNKINDAFRERHDSIDIADEEKWKILLQDISREKYLAFARLLKHLHNVEGKAKPSSEAYIGIDVDRNASTMEEKNQCKKELQEEQNASSEEYEKAKSKWEFRLFGREDYYPTEEENSSNTLLEERRKLLFNQRAYFSTYERLLIDRSVERRVLGEQLSILENSQNLSDIDLKKMNIKIRRKAFLDGYITYLDQFHSDKGFDDKAKDKATHLIDALCDLNRDEYKVWRVKEDKPTSADLEATLASLKESILPKIEGRLSDRIERMERELVDQRRESASKKSLTVFQIHFDELEEVLQNARRIKDTANAGKVNELLDAFDKAEDKWQRIKRAIQQEKLRWELEISKSWIKKQKKYLKKTRAVAMGTTSSTLMQKLNEFERGLDTRTTQMAVLEKPSTKIPTQAEASLETLQSITAIQEAENYLAQFNNERPALLQDVNMQLMAQIPHLVPTDKDVVAGELERWQVQNGLDQQENPLTSPIGRHAKAWTDVMQLLKKTQQQLETYKNLPENLRRPDLLEAVIEQAVRLAKYQKTLQTLRTQGQARWSNILDDQIEKPHELPAEAEKNRRIQQWLQLQSHIQRMEGLTTTLSLVPSDSNNADVHANLTQAIADELKNAYAQHHKISGLSNNLRGLSSLKEPENQAFAELATYIESRDHVYANYNKSVIDLGLQQAGNALGIQLETLDTLIPALTEEMPMRLEAESNRVEWQTSLDTINRDLGCVHDAPTDDLALMQEVINKERANHIQRGVYLRTLRRMSKWLPKPSDGDDRSNGPRPPPENDGTGKSNKTNRLSITWLKQKLKRRKTTTNDKTQGKSTTETQPEPLNVVQKCNELRAKRKKILTTRRPIIGPS